MQDPDYIKKSLKEYQKGEITLILVAIVILGGLLLTGGLANFALNQNTDSPSYLNTQNSAPSNLIPVYSPNHSTKSLQMGTFTFTTPAPTLPSFPPITPGEFKGVLPCTPGQDIAIAKQLEKEETSQCGPQPNIRNNPQFDSQYRSWQICKVNVDSTFRNVAVGQYNCVPIGKPVIYLYPKVTTNVQVTLALPGSITKSIPVYPNGGWKNILAQPDGILYYHKKKYHELYYESLVNASSYSAPQNGILIPTVNLRKKLSQYTHQLGLKPNETQEFLDYWLPKLYALKSPYILFSVLTPQEKDRIDHVDISPKPDTMIEFLVYFKPLWKIDNIKPLKLPTIPPKRIGFTAVEWGGTIDTH